MYSQLCEPIERRATRRKPTSFAAAFGAPPPRQRRERQTRQRQPGYYTTPLCPRDHIPNPLGTGRCIKLGGDTHRQLYGSEPVAKLCPAGQVRNPSGTGRCIKIGGPTHKQLFAQPKQQPQPKEIRRTSSEGPVKLPLGSAGIAPLADKPTILGWAHSQCKNNRDPLSDLAFASADTAALQDLIRLHDRTCVMSGPLNAKVTAEHKSGQIATIPGDPSTHLTLDDFKALRDSRRRHDPAYKIPGRKHQPTPANWKLYIASDNRSGAEFASVLFVDETKVVQGPYGPEYPVEAVVADLGFIPLTINDALCKPQMVTELIKRLADANRLLAPVAGGWKPVGGFPFSKKHWATDGRERLGKLCQAMIKLLSSPV